jgi:hypothetical protein
LGALDQGYEVIAKPVPHLFDAALVGGTIELMPLRIVAPAGQKGARRIVERQELTGVEP